MTKERLVAARIRAMVREVLIELLVPDSLVDSAFQSIVLPVHYTWDSWDSAIREAAERAVREASP